MEDVKGYEGFYQIDRNGNIWSCPKISKYTPNHNGRYLKKYKDRGYEYATLYKNGKNKKIAIHRLVAFQFIPNDKNKPHINHINGDKSDNRVENLEWCTPKENCIHAWENGLSQTSNKMRELSKVKMKKWNNSEKGKNFCSENGKARRKLSKEQVLEIINKNKNGQSAYSLAKEYPVSKPTILKIIRRETYKEFTNE